MPEISTPDPSLVSMSTASERNRFSSLLNVIKQAWSWTSSRITFKQPVSVANILLTGAAASPPVADVLYKDNIVRGWVACTPGNTILDSFNVSSTTDTSVGRFVVNWDTDFADGDYVAVATALELNIANAAWINAMVAGSVTIGTARSQIGSFADPTEVHVMAIGSQ